MILATLTLLLGLLLGFYGRQLYDMLKDIYDDFTYRREATQAGVVRPEKRLASRNQPQDLSVGKESGIVMRPTPTQAIVRDLSIAQNTIDRNAKLKRS